MSLSEKLAGMFEQDMLDRISQSWCLQDKAERKHRLKTVVALCVELEAIKQAEKFNALLGEAAIEAVIEGDWADAEGWVEHFTFEGENEQIRAKYAAIWEKFRVILMTAVSEKKTMIPGIGVRSN